MSLYLKGQRKAPAGMSLYVELRGLSKLSKAVGMTFGELMSLPGDVVETLKEIQCGVDDFHAGTK